MTHISLELAKWLKERGCEVENGMCILLDCNELCRKEDLGDYRIGRDAMRTYSWYDILVTHAKEFWGDDFWVCDECGKLSSTPSASHDAYENGDQTVCVCRQLNDGDSPLWVTRRKYHTKGLLDLLQYGKIQEAEDYVRKYSVFANPKP